ncbi:MAG TPA: hypothetical protein VHH88_03695, partial [Verrucomicrobiae bacterium]|nr:hypothetical protein [Verrucomicrobiae bacterium]
LTVWSQVFSNSASVGGICLGSSNFVASTSTGQFLVSANGTAWQATTPEPVPLGCRNIEFLNGQFVAVEGNQLSFSSDGSVWTNTITISNLNDSATLTSITFGHGRYVAGGAYGPVWTSLDGVNWTNPAPDLSTFPDYTDVHVAFGNDVFVGAAGDQADILTSSDGLSWTVRQLITNTSSPVSFSDITFGNGRFVAVSPSLAATSIDGQNWETSPLQYPITAATAGNGKFVGVGFGIVAVSSDGLNWVYQNSSDFYGLYDVSFGAGWFVATGNEALPAPPTEAPIWISQDGVHWFKRHSSTSRRLYCTAFGDGTFVLAGGGAVLQSDPLLTLDLVVNPAPILRISGPVDRAYRVEFSDGLGPGQSWSVLTNVTANQSPISIGDTNAPSRFYRAALLPN